MSKIFVIVAASVVLLFVAAPAGAFVTFSSVAGNYYSDIPETYFSVGSGSDVAGTWNWSLALFPDPPPAIDKGPITAGIFEEAAEVTPYGFNDPFDWNLGSLNTVADDGRMAYATASRGDGWAPVYAFGNHQDHSRMLDPDEDEYADGTIGEVPPVPEPGTLLLVGLVLVGGGVIRKWR
jgi:hypothetical protein